MSDPTQAFRNHVALSAGKQNFRSLKEFATWYGAMGFPILCMQPFEIFRSDDAVAIPVFRHEKFQVELYVIDNAYEVKDHAHPFVEVIQTAVLKSGSGVDGVWAAFGDALVFPVEHGGGTFGFNTEKSTGSSLFLTFEKWDEAVKVSTLAAAWKGKTAGPLQESLIRRFFPNAHIENGYADVTRIKYAT